MENFFYVLGAMILLTLLLIPIGIDLIKRDKITIKFEIWFMIIILLVLVGIGFLLNFLMK